MYLEKENHATKQFSCNYARDLMNQIEENIHLTACDSISAAFDLIESKKFDVVLCDMNSNSKILKIFFNEYSQKIPIISISSSNDPKIAYISAKMGAREFIIKNDKDLKMVSKSIHKIYVEWTREKEQKNSLQLLNDTNVRTVLRDLINTELPITQRINASLESNIKINETIKNI